VLGEFARVGHTPPPPVILCAIAEAEALGLEALASDIIRVFVAPVVYQHEMANARPLPRAAACSPREGFYAGAAACSPREGSYARAASCSPREAFYTPSAPVLALPESRHSWMSAHLAAMEPAQRGDLVARRSPSSGVRAAAASAQIPATDEEIRAMINADPEGFIAMATRGMPGMPAMPTIEVVHPATVHAPPPSSIAPLQLAASPAQPPELPPEMVAQMQEAAGLHEAADQTRALAPGSPLDGVTDDGWRQFVTCLEREEPSFNSSRHVGQYRQHRERLAELGIDPDAIAGSAQAQRVALDADLVDAHHHAANGGLLADHVGRAVTIPGHDGAETITLSGVLGVIQCAGLEGAVGWLERPNDRKRYPHTTRVFLRTNGSF